jgi:hypothetical protein
MKARGIANVEQGTPHLAAIMKVEGTLAERVLDERVDHQVVTHARRKTEQRSHTQDDRAEIRTSHGEKFALAGKLGQAVGGARRRRSGLVEEDIPLFVDDAHVVDGARGGVNVARDAAAAGGFGEETRGHAVHLKVGIGGCVRRWDR